MSRRQPERGEPVELEFALEDDACFFVAASAEADCELVAEEFVRRTDGHLLEFFSVRGARPESLREVADRRSDVTDARTVDENSESTLMAFVVTGPCVAATLADADAVLRQARAEGGHATVVADVLPHADVRPVVERFHDRHSDAELVAKRTLDGPIPAFSGCERAASLTGALTEKQLRAVKTATQYGYLSWPRESTATECANALGISQSTFSQHLWTGVEKLLSTVFESEPSADVRDGT